MTGDDAEKVEAETEIVEAEKPIPLTVDEFREEMEDLVHRASKAGISPIKEVGQTYVRKLFRFLDTCVTALEEGGAKKGKGS